MPCAVWRVLCLAVTTCRAAAVGMVIQHRMAGAAVDAPSCLARGGGSDGGGWPDSSSCWLQAVSISPGSWRRRHRAVLGATTSSGEKRRCCLTCVCIGALVAAHYACSTRACIACSERFASSCLAARVLSLLVSLRPRLPSLSALVSCAHLCPRVPPGSVVCAPGSGCAGRCCSRSWAGVQCHAAAVYRTAVSFRGFDHACGTID